MKLRFVQGKIATSLFREIAMYCLMVFCASFLRTNDSQSKENDALGDIEINQAKKILECIVESSFSPKLDRIILFDSKNHLDIPLRIFLYMDKNISDRKQEFYTAIRTVKKLKSLGPVPVVLVRDMNLADVTIFVSGEIAFFRTSDFTDYLKNNGFDEQRTKRISLELNATNISERVAFKKEVGGVYRIEVLRFVVENSNIEKTINKSILSSLGYVCHSGKFNFDTVLNDKTQKISSIDFFLLNFLYSKYFNFTFSDSIDEIYKALENYIRSIESKN